MTEEVEQAAERLRVFIETIGEDPYSRAGEAHSRYGFEPEGYANVMREGETPADWAEFDLAWQCAGVAQDLREQGWAALETVAGLGSPRYPVGSDAWLDSLAPAEMRPALAALLRLGWLVVRR